AGQRWLAGTTVLVDPRRARTFVDELCREALAVRTGVVSETGTTMGPVIPRFRPRELLDRVESAAASSDVVVNGSAFGERPGYFFGPTVVDRVAPDHPLVIDQVPGPLVSIVRAPPDAERAVRQCDADRVVRTVHGGPGDAARAERGGWFGSLPWAPERQLSFLVD